MTRGAARRVRVVLLIALLAMLLAGAVPAVRGQGPRILFAEVTGAIDRSTVDYLQEAVGEARSGGYTALMVRFDTLAVEEHGLQFFDDRPPIGDQDRNVAPEALLRWVRLAVGTRSGYPPPHLDRYGDRVVPFELDSPEVSSSEVRERAALGEPLDGLVPPPVEAAIRESGLYRGYTGSGPEDRQSH